MPLLSREVLTLRFIFECDEYGEENAAASEQSQKPSPLLCLPVELRLEILRHLLCLDCNRKAHTRRPPQSSISELLYLNPRRILEAAPFKHKGNQEINGNPPIIKSCHLHPAILKTCKQLYWEGRTVLYTDNKVLAIQSGIKGLGAKLKNYGVPVLGPFPSTRLICGPRDGSQPAHFRFNPLMLFTGANTKPDAPFYISSHLDAADFMHALWIMVKSPFARGMGLNLTLSTELHPRHIGRTDSFVKLAVLPWLHPNINSIKFLYPHNDKNQADAGHRPLGGRELLASGTTCDRSSIQDEFDKHLLASQKEPNLHIYRAICDYLERILLQGEICVDQGNFISGELSFERVCYEACSLVRTRTSALVDVSSRSKDGINRICKLIAVSAFRLCELRSGSLAQLVLKRQQKQQVREKGKEKASPDPEVCDRCRNVELCRDEVGEHSEDSASTLNDDSPSIASRSDVRSNNPESSPRAVLEMPPGPALKGLQAASAKPGPPKSPNLPRTTRLEPPLARDLALTSGLLALRLPCASPVPEWNIRLDTMLLRLFALRNDFSNAVWCIRRIHNNGTVVINGIKQKNKAGDKKWESFTELMHDLAQQLRPGAPRDCFFETADKVEQVVALLWGERLIPKKGFNGLIWTFRWAG
ncbi:hypothetical protein G647_07970 [Cladophialophora carrionii CBS 160.54]|uniref:F-box domain-containing protein n=1 Tax=Cladophialophora carrionii CBS 160.54 TaxID=1279043 RepID=V9D5Q0_9EURO|nr:uncharacterized protein G647_07970 [Cladophialophora carrionii CBS 160.54]ETI21623.1 hypothetical protein G647_07970 [Cladophialophora carrionii CBS 160.54]